MLPPTRRGAELRALGPFVTRTGMRMPVVALGTTDISGLLEFYDYRARRGAQMEILGQDGTREALAATSGSAFEGRSVLGVRSSQIGPIRGVFEIRLVADAVAEVGFLLDESVDSLDLVTDVLARLIDLAKAEGICQLEVDAADSSMLFSALRAAGHPMRDGERAGRRVITLRGDESGVTTPPPNARLAP